MVSRIHRRQINKDPVLHPAGHWSERQKYEAVTTYLLVGKWPIVSDQTKVPIDTLKKWKQSSWWKEMEDEIRTATRIDQGSSLHRIINKAASVVEDRLEHGELIYNPESKKFTRRPVGAKVASEILTKSIDRSMLMDKLVEKPVIKEEAIMDRLKNIENALVRASSKRKPNNEIIDVSPVERVEQSSISYADHTPVVHPLPHSPSPNQYEPDTPTGGLSGTDISGRSELSSTPDYSGGSGPSSEQSA